MLFFGRQKARKPARQQQGFRLTLEVLEDRTVPSGLAAGSLPADLPPEINSARISASAGSGPLLEAAARRDGLAAALRSQQASIDSVMSALAGRSGTGSGAMNAAAAEFTAWLSATPARAENAASQARAAVSADEIDSAIAALFSAHAQAYQALSAQAAAFHQQFVQALQAAAESADAGVRPDGLAIITDSSRALLPEINSARLLAGSGSDRLLAAARRDGLAAELRSQLGGQRGPSGVSGADERPECHPRPASLHHGS
jgi:hypothetical protein